MPKPTRSSFDPELRTPEVLRLRRRMDRLNARLAALLQQRARLALTIGRAKRRRGLAAADLARERAMLRAASVGAAAGFSKQELQRLLRAVFAASRALVVRDRRGR